MINNFTKYDFPTFGYIKIPKVTIPEKELAALNLKSDATATQIITAITRIGFKEKESQGLIPKEKRQQYIDKIKEELQVFDNLGFSDYVLIVYDIINFNKKHGRINSPSRGSAGGSIVFYLMGIIQIDPIKYNLLFSRFLSAARASFKEINGEIYLESGNICDVDIDLENSFKDQVKVYLNEKYPNRTALISTISTFSGKILLKEVLKSYEGVNEEVAKAASDLIDKKFGRNDSFEESMKNNDKFIKWSASHSKSVELCKKLEDLNKNKSVHASATLLTYDPIPDVIPLELSSDKRTVTSYDMNYAQMIGIKLDLLGLRTLDVVNGCLKAIGKKITDIDVNDKSIYDYLKSCDQYRGLFQIEDGIGKQTIQKVKPDDINELSLCIALGRPGCMNFIDDYVAFKEEKTQLNIDKRLEDLLKPTAGIIVYQESLMQLSMRMGGFTEREADSVRKSIGKKLIDKMLQCKDKFIEGSIKNGYTKEFSEETWKSFEASANYSFNKCLSPETIVEKENGELVKMDVIKIGDKIKAYDIDLNKDCNVEIDEIYKDEVELFEVQLEDGRVIKCSMKHKFLCLDKKMHTLEEVIKKNLQILTD